MERCLTHRLPFPDRRPTEGGKTQPATSVDTRARRLLPSIPRSDRADRARRAVPVCRRAGRQRRRQDVWREGRRRLVRRRARRPDLPGALLPRRDPLAAGGREGLLERRGGHPPGARVRATAQDRPRSDGRPRTHADEQRRRSRDDRTGPWAGYERARRTDDPRATRAQRRGSTRRGRRPCPSRSSSSVVSRCSCSPRALPATSAGAHRHAGTAARPARPDAPPPHARV